MYLHVLTVVLCYFIGSRGLVASNYQLAPRNYVVNQGVQGTGVAVQLSPHQMGTNLGPAALSPIDQQHLIQSAATFDTQLAALQQTQAQQQVAFQNAAGQLMIQSPPQQLLLQSPNQQFTLQSPSQHFTLQNQSQFTNQNQNMAQFAPQQQIIPQGQGGNVILQGQNTGMIVQGENFIQSGVNPSMFLHSPIVQNVGQQIYGTTQNLIANNQMQGMFTQQQVLTNQGVGLISINQSPSGKNYVENIDKTDNSGQSAGMVNQQMQLLAHIAQQASPNGNNQTVVSNVIKPNQQAVNVGNQAQTMASTVNQNQSLPSFGHFLLHHHMQSLPHPFLQNLHIPSLAPAQAPMCMEVDSSQATKPVVSIAANSPSNLNAEFNNWNKGQVQGRVRKNSSPARSIAPNLTSKSSLVIPSATVTQVQASSCDVKSAVSQCSSVTSSSSKSDHLVTKTCVNTLAFKTSPQPKHTVKVEHGATVASPTVKSETHPKSILVPYGWTRILEGDSILYYR